MVTLTCDLKKQDTPEAFKSPQFSHHLLLISFKVFFIISDLLLPDVFQCKHLSVCRCWGGLNDSAVPQPAGFTPNLFLGAKPGFCWTAAAFRVHHYASFYFWSAATSPNARILALVFPDTVETGSAIWSEPGGSIQQATCRANTSAAHIRHWQLSLITFERARDSWVLAMAPIGVWDASSQLHTGWANQLFSEPLLSIITVGWEGRGGELRWRQGMGTGCRGLGEWWGPYSRSLIRFHGAL